MMKPHVRLVVPMLALALLTACGGLSQIRLDNSPSPPLPPNYIDTRSAEARRSTESGYSTYYGDSHLSPPLSVLFLSCLYQQMGKDIGATQVTLERADLVVTLPHFSYPLQGGPLMLLTEPKYIRVDLSGKIGGKEFIHGVTRKVHAGPTDSDIQGTVDQAIAETIDRIRKGQQSPQANAQAIQ